MSTLPCYFDYAATTPVDDRVIQAMVTCLGREGTFGNPASNSHAYGNQARQAVELARRQVAELVGTDAAAVVWTSGARLGNAAAVGVWADRRRVCDGMLPGLPPAASTACAAPWSAA